MARESRGRRRQPADPQGVGASGRHARSAGLPLRELEKNKRPTWARVGFYGERAF
jgi:hypothetical protein